MARVGVIFPGGINLSRDRAPKRGVHGPNPSQSFLNLSQSFWERFRRWHERDKGMIYIIKKYFSSYKEYLSQISRPLGAPVVFLSFPLLRLPVPTGVPFFGKNSTRDEGLLRNTKNGQNGK